MNFPAGFMAKLKSSKTSLFQIIHGHLLLNSCHVGVRNNEKKKSDAGR